MPRNEATGTKQVGQSVEADLWDRFVAFCRGRKQTIRRNLEEALRRHMANPPTLDLPPLPPAPPKKRSKP
jgi:hypothetical protein